MPTTPVGPFLQTRRNGTEKPDSVHPYHGISDADKELEGNGLVRRWRRELLDGESSPTPVTDPSCTKCGS